MKAFASYVFLLCLLLAAPAAAESTSSEDPGCAVPIEDVSADGDQEVSLLQLGTEKHERRAGSLHRAVAQKKSDFEIKKCVAEFIAMFLFVFIGCGSAMSMANTDHSAWILQVSLTFGLAITVLAYTIGHYSGGHINCAVTFGLVLTGNVTVVQGLGNLVAQLLGSVLGAALLSIVYSTLPTTSLDKTGGLGTNTVDETRVPISTALIMEIVGTFILMYVVLECACNETNNYIGDFWGLAIGFAVFLAHSVLVAIDGCSINPTRSTGPAIINALVNPKSDGKEIRQLWIFWVGPLIGSALAAGVYTCMAS